MDFYTRAYVRTEAWLAAIAGKLFGKWIPGRFKNRGDDRGDLQAIAGVRRDLMRARARSK